VDYDLHIASNIRSAVHTRKKADQKTDRDNDVGWTYRALKKAGSIGCFRGGGGVGATKEVVRARVLERFRNRAERQPIA
jgi:hypothetical protein